MLISPFSEFCPNLTSVVSGFLFHFHCDANVSVFANVINVLSVFFSSWLRQWMTSQLKEGRRVNCQLSPQTEHGETHFLRSGGGGGGGGAPCFQTHFLSASPPPSPPWVGATYFDISFGPAVDKPLGGQRAPQDPRPPQSWPGLENEREVQGYRGHCLLFHLRPLHTAHKIQPIKERMTKKEEEKEKKKHGAQNPPGWLLDQHALVQLPSLWIWNGHLKGSRASCKIRLEPN